MSYFLLQPRSAYSSKDTARPAFLQVHFVLFSHDLILAPVLCSASTGIFVAARHIRLGNWFSWEKNTLHFPGYFSAGSVSHLGFTGCPQKYLRQLNKGLHQDRDKQLGASRGLLETDQLSEPGLKMTICATETELCLCVALRDVVSGMVVMS